MSLIPPLGRVVLAAALTLVLTAAGCHSPRAVTSSPSAPSARMSSVSAGETFEVQRGGAVLVDGQRLRFEAVVNDSRCPADVNCIRAGEAVATFSFVGARAIGPLRLQIPGFATTETAPQPEQSATRGAFRFTLLALTPYPGTAEAEAGERPVATLRVERL